MAVAWGIVLFITLMLPISTIFYTAATMLVLWLPYQLRYCSDIYFLLGMLIGYIVVGILGSTFFFLYIRDVSFIRFLLIIVGISSLFIAFPHICYVFYKFIKSPKQAQHQPIATDVAMPHSIPRESFASSCATPSNKAPLFKTIPPKIVLGACVSGLWGIIVLATMFFLMGLFRF